MITPGLERAIQKGIAQYHTFTLGASGVGTIPVPDNQFIIITDFDYFNFLDLPSASPGNPASGFIVLDPSQLLPEPIQFIFGAFGSITATVIWGDALNTTLNIQAQLDIFFPGWVCSVGGFGGNTFIFSFATTNTALYNGTIITFTSGIPAPVEILNQPINGGADPVYLDLNAVLAKTVHQIEFRTRKSRNHFVIRDDVSVFNASVFGVPGPQNYFFNVKGKYQKNTYLVHDEDVQVNILTLPPVQLWFVLMAQCQPFSQENSQPVGYGTFPTGELANQLMFFDAGGVTQEYQPLTVKRSGFGAVVAPQYREQFRVDPNPQNTLQNPQNLFGAFWNNASYPIVNIGYVSINKNETDHVLGSNG